MASPWETSTSPKRGPAGLGASRMWGERGRSRDDALQGAVHVGGHVDSSAEKARNAYAEATRGRPADAAAMGRSSQAESIVRRPASGERRGRPQRELSESRDWPDSKSRSQSAASVFMEEPGERRARPYSRGSQDPKARNSQAEAVRGRPASDAAYLVEGERPQTWAQCDDEFEDVRGQGPQP